MQVSQIAELDTHAVIGGSKAKEFFISESADFFTMLSKTLYKDEMLAVAREVTCNADDAHKMVGKQDVAIEITITDDELIIKDFGPGIADGKMHGTYCGYGVSTKVADDTQTGGFGLGCKAPFAYSDHFTVTSCHQGWRSVYAISRGGIDTDGKPGLIRMVKVKTEESGITVSIPLKNKQDRYKFDQLVRRVVRQGGIKATINGAEVSTYDVAAFDKTGFGMVNANDMGESPVYVRYGAVMYPISVENTELMSKVNFFLSGTGMKLILSAPPGSIGVTPSREALSYTEKTIKALSALLDKATRQLLGMRSYAIRLMAEEMLAKRKDLSVPVKMKLDAKQSLDTGDVLAMTKELILRALELVHYETLLGDFRPSADEQRKALLKAAMRKHRDHRRVFRRLSGSPLDAKNRFMRGSKIAPDTTRVLIRMASKLGILKLVSRYGYRADTGRANSVLDVHTLTRCAYPFPEKPRLMLVRGKTQAVEYIFGHRTDVDRDNVAFITVRDLKDDRLAELKRVAKQYGFEVGQLDIAKPVRVKKEKIEKPKEAYYDLADARVCGESIGFNDLKRTIDHAPVFIDMHSTLLGGGEGGYKKDVRDIYKHRTEILAAYPKVALAHGQMQVKALIAAGSLELKDAMQRDFKALEATPEIDFALLAGKSMFIDNAHGRSPSSFAVQLAQSDLRYAKLLAEQRMIVTARELKAFALAKLLGNVPMHEKEPNRPVYNAVWGRLHKAQNTRPKRSTFEYLAPLANLWGYGRGTDDQFFFNDDTVELIRFLQRKKLKSVVNNPQPLKEAA